MKQYHDLSLDILKKGEYEWNERTKTGTISLFGEKSTYDLKEGFPLVTTKHLGYRLPMEEMNFFLRGDKSVRSLIDKNVNIWNDNAFDFYLRRNNLTKDFPKHSQEWRDKSEWYVNKVKTNDDFAEKEGTLGRVYGVQWRDWNHSFDQIKKFIENLKKNPSSRSNIFSGWNPSDLNDMALPPCHLLTQSRVIDGRLDLLMFQRSCDTLLGVPFNIAQYAYLNHLMAREANLQPGKFQHLYGNVHFYTGTGERGEFFKDSKNLEEFQKGISEANSSEEYVAIQDWYLHTAPKEPIGTEGTDHIPFVLMQLARDTKKLPNLEWKIDESIDFWKAITMPIDELISIKGYKKSEHHPELAYEFDGKLIKPVMAA
jgi:thymidylate synthase